MIQNSKFLHFSVEREMSPGSMAEFGVVDMDCVQTLFGVVSITNLIKEVDEQQFQQFVVLNDWIQFVGKRKEL